MFRKLLLESETNRDKNKTTDEAKMLLRIRSKSVLIPIHVVKDINQNLVTRLAEIDQLLRTIYDELICNLYVSFSTTALTAEPHIIGNTTFVADPIINSDFYDRLYKKRIELSNIIQKIQAALTGSKNDETSFTFAELEATKQWLENYKNQIINNSAVDEENYVLQRLIEPPKQAQEVDSDTETLDDDEEKALTPEELSRFLSSVEDLDLDQKEIGDAIPFNEKDVREFSYSERWQFFESSSVPVDDEDEDEAEEATPLAIAKTNIVRSPGRTNLAALFSGINFSSHNLTPSLPSAASLLAGDDDEDATFTSNLKQ